MARSVVYIGIDLLPDRACYVGLGAKGETLFGGQKPFHDPASWNETIAEILAEVPLKSKLVWGIAPSFASGVSRSFFVPAEAQPLSEYVRWETGLYLGADSKEFAISWDKLPRTPEGRMVNVVAVRKKEMEAFAVSLERVGAEPDLVESRLFAAANAVEFAQGAAAPKVYSVLVQEGALLRFGFVQNGTMPLQSQTLLRADSADERIAEFLGRAPAPSEAFFAQAGDWFDEERRRSLSDAHGIPVGELPRAEGVDLQLAVAWAVAHRCKEGAL
ncbi:MAG: hypothetical protein J6Z50_02945 [Fibrobacterales bacterium]|nr:hypothetical protein [Fibrobacterales bacterium]MBP5188067.1 hypothetical protein [Fibrobacterales bacterium]MBP5350806.1 hypothetical protein [Fibrobacterales bacterium]